MYNFTLNISYKQATLLSKKHAQQELFYLISKLLIQNQSSRGVRSGIAKTAIDIVCICLESEMVEEIKDVNHACKIRTLRKHGVCYGKRKSSNKEINLRRNYRSPILDHRALLFCVCLTFKPANAVKRELWGREC